MHVSHLLNIRKHGMCLRQQKMLIISVVGVNEAYRTTTPCLARVQHSVHNLNSFSSLVSVAPVFFVTQLYRFSYQRLH